MKEKTFFGALDKIVCIFSFHKVNSRVANENNLNIAYINFL